MMPESVVFGEIFSLSVLESKPVDIISLSLRNLSVITAILGVLSKLILLLDYMFASLVFKLYEES